MWPARVTIVTGGWGMGEFGGWSLEAVVFWLLVLLHRTLSCLGVCSAWLCRFAYGLVPGLCS